MGAVWRLRNSLPRGEWDLPSARRGSAGTAPRQGGVRPEGWGGRWRPGGSSRSGAGGGARESAPGGMGCARKCLGCSVRSESRRGEEGARSVCFLVLCTQGQRVCRQGPVGVHGCVCGCAPRVSGARPV